MRCVNITFAKTHLSSLLRGIKKNNETLIITHRGQAIAKIEKYSPKPTFERLGFARGLISLAENYDEWPKDIAVNLGIEDLG